MSKINLPVLNPGYKQGKYPVKPTYDVFFWEEIYQIELKHFLRLIEKKANYLKKLENTDLLEVNQSDPLKAEKIHKQIELLSEELNVMVGMKLFMDDLKAAYLESSVLIDQTYRKQLITLQKQIIRLKRDYSFEHQCHLNCIEFSLFQCKQGLKYFDQIIELKAELSQYKFSGL